MLKLAYALLAFALWSVTAIAQNPPSTAPGTPSPPSAGCPTCGVVESIRHVEKKGEGSGVGAIAGGVLGGVLGHQIGSGRGNTAATIVGAGAGAYAGNEVERNSKKKSYYVVAVRLDDGRRQTVSQGARPGMPTTGAGRRFLRARGPGCEKETGSRSSVAIGLR